MQQLNLKLTLNDNGSITASWSPITGAAKYTAFMQPVGKSYMIYNETNLRTTSYTSRANLEDNTQYKVVVTAYDSKSMKIVSAGAQQLIKSGFYRDKQPLGVPQNVTAVSDVISVTVRFDKVAYATGYDILFDNTVYSTTATSKTFSNLNSNTNHSYAVRAKNASKTGAYSATKYIATKIKTPAVPSGIKKSVTVNSATISWNAVSGATGYDLMFNGSVSGMYGINATSKTFSGLAAGKAYSFQIRAKNANAVSAYTQAMTVTTAPTVPTGVKAAATQNAVTVSWNTVTGASGYIVRFQGAEYAYGASARSAVINGLKAETSYTYQVCARSVDGIGAYSVQQTIQTLAEPPAVPTGITAQATDRTVMIRWTYSKGAGSYDLLFNGTVYNTVQNFIEVTGLNPYTAYTYQVKAKSSKGDSAYSNAMTVRTAPKAPVVTVKTTENTAVLSWPAVSGATGYDLLFGGETYSVTGTSKTFTGLNPNVNYYCQIRVKSAYGTSNYSSVQSAVTAPNPPAAPKGTSTKNSVTVSWDAVKGAVSYDLLFNGTTHRVNGTSKTVTGLNPGTKYSYQVRSNNAYGASSYSAAGTIETIPNPPAVPTNVSASAAGRGLTISWNLVSGADSYDIMLNGRNVYHAEKSPFQINGLIPDTEYTYQVRAVNAGGAGAYSAARNIKTLLLPPGIPQKILAVAGADQIALSWEPVEKASGYDVLFQNVVHSVTEAEYTAEGLKPAMLYTYCVRAKNAAGASSYSQKKSIRTLLKTPSGVHVEAQARTVTIGFDPVEGAYTYEITFGGEVYSTKNTSLEISGLRPKTEYPFTICAKNHVAESEAVYQGTVTTTAAIPATPSDITAEAFIDSVEIRFSAVEDATDYDIELDGKIYNIKEGDNFIHVEDEGTVSSLQRVRKSARRAASGASSMQVQSMSAKEGSSGKVCAVCGVFPANTAHSHSVRANSEAGSSPFSAKAVVKIGLQAVSGLAGRKSSNSYPDGKPSYTGNDPVNALTGAFLWSYTWLQDYGKDDLHFTVMYDSKRDSFSKVLGKKWSHELNYLLSMDEEYAYFVIPAGDVTPFKKEEDGSFRGEGTACILCKTENGFYCVKQTDGTEYLFDENLTLSRIMENGLVSYRFETDGAGHIIRIAGRHGGSLTLTYTGEQITGVEDRMGNGVSLTYQNGMLIQMQNAQKKSLSFTYDKAGNLLTITDFTGRVYLTNQYDIWGRVIQQETAGRGKSFAAYDKENRTTVFTDEAGNTTRYTYDEAGHIIEVSLAGVTTCNSYNETGQLVSQTDGLGRTTAMAYDEKGRMNLVIYPDGTKEETVYNEQNKPIQIINRDGTENLYEYDERGNLIKAVDERGNAVSYTYDDRDNLTAYTDQEGHVWSYAYDENNHLKETKDPEGNTCLYRHDALGRLLSHTSAEGNTVTYRYAPAGELLEIQDSDGTLVFAYDENGNRTQTTDRMGNTQRLEYNEMGQVSLATDFSGNEYRFSYDERGSLTAQTDPLGHSMTYAYDALFNTTAVTDKNGNTTEYFFDAANQLTQVKDAAGGTLKYAYDTMGQVKTVTDPLGHQTAYEYDSMGQLIRVTDALGNEIVLTYDAAGNLLTQTDAEGEVTAYTYDAQNRVTSIRTSAGTQQFTYDTLGRVTATADVDGYQETAAYDGDGNLLAVSDKEEKCTVYAYDAAGRMTQVTDPDGGVTSYEYDKNGNCIKVTDAEGNARTYEYNADNRLLCMTDPSGGKILYEYDAAGRLTGVTDAGGGKTAYEYDANGSLICETNPLGGRKTYVYDALNRMIQSTDEEGFTSSFAYDAAGNRISFTDANENRWEYAYDALNRLTQITDQEGGSLQLDYTKTGRISKVTDAEGAQTTYTYDGAGRLTGMQDALEHSVSFTYDAMGRMLTQTDENGNTSSFVYSPTGNLLSVTDPEGGVTAYTYNALRQILTKTDPTGNTVSCEYDALGQVTSLTDACGERTLFTYTAAGQIATVTDAEGNVTQYEYDPKGNLTKIRDASGNVVCYEYDAMNNQIRESLNEGEEAACITLYQYDKRGCLIREINPLLSEKSYTYDGNRNVLTEIDEEENVTVVRYDLNNRPVYMGYDDGREAVLRYNKRGELVELQDWNGTAVMERDLLGRLTKVTDPKGRSTGYAYDAAGNRTGITYPDGSAVTFGYDKNGRLNKVTDGEESVQYSYDAAGRLTAAVQPGGNASYAYNAAGLPLQAGYRTKDGVSIEDSFTYDRMGRIITAERKGSEEAYSRSAAYGYDSLGRLLSCTEGADSETYSYDALGNRTLRKTGAGQTVYRYDAMNRLISLTETGTAYSYGYDRRGNLTEERRNDSLIRQYVYDAAGRMVQGKNLETGEESSYVYNALGRRVKYTEKRDGGLKETEYTADDVSGVWNDLMQYGTGGTVTRNVYGRGYEILSRRTDINPEGKTYYHADLYGSPLMAADAEGNFKWYAERGIWGNLKERKGAGEDAWGDSLRFTTYPYDPVTGKHFAYARMYDGMQGRMHGTDPVKRGLNGYAYCDNDPVNRVDPDGEIANLAVGMIGGGIFGGAAGFISSAISQSMKGEKFSFKKALGAAAEGAVIGGAKGAMISSGFGAAAMFAGDFAAGTAGNMLNRAISGEKQNLGESLWGGALHAVGNAAFGTKPVGGLGNMVYRSARASGAVTLVSDLAEMSGTGNKREAINPKSGKRSTAKLLTAGIRNGITGGGLGSGSRRDPRTICRTGDAFSGGIGSQGSRGYQQTGGSSGESRFDFGRLVKDVAMNSLIGGLAGAAFYGFDKAVGAVCDGIRGRRSKGAEISASGNPKDILFEDAPLNNRQQRLLSELQNYGDTAIVKKNDVNLKDISALTAYTGNEFAMFTNKGQRMVVRGNSVKVPVNVNMAQEYAAQGWRWSGHSHPGMTRTVLSPSEDDRIILQQFTNQRYSTTVNSVGNYQRFSKDWSDWLPTY